MEEDIQNFNTSSSNNIISQRSPTYSKDEVRALVNLIEKYKSIILNKCTNSTNNHAKEVAWAKISKEINKQGFKHSRNVESLKTKWENLKKEARKISKNVINVKNSEVNDILCQIVLMINETENYNLTEIPHTLLQEMNDNDEEDTNLSKIWDQNDNKQSEDSAEQHGIQSVLIQYAEVLTVEVNYEYQFQCLLLSLLLLLISTKALYKFLDGDENGKLMYSRSLNFSPQECSLLLKCVRDEKKHILCKESTAQAIKLKNNAWNRITHIFNKVNSEKRTTKVLRTKFYNMKRLTKTVSLNSYFTSNQHEILEEDNAAKNIKAEPQIEYKNNMDTESNNDCIESDFADIHCDTRKTNEELSDPLSTVLNGDSGIDSISHFGSCSQSENKEVVKLKLELLKYKLETAKLERQRIKEALQAETVERQSKAIETSLRVRAARLELVAAEAKLPSAHPALRYTDREDLARQYLQEFSQNLTEIKIFE